MLIATWNVNGIRARAASFSRWLHVCHPDVLCLQEIKAHPDQIPEHIRSIEGYTSYWHGARGGYSGVSIHVRKSSVREAEFSVPHFDEETRVVQVDCARLSAICVYTPLGQRSYRQKLEFLDSLIGYIDALHYEGRQVLLCGDLNVAHRDHDVHPDMAGEDVIGLRPEERVRIDRILSLGMSDVFRKHNPHIKNAYSWWPYFGRGRERNVGWRIDYIFASNALMPRSRGCRIMKEEASSDHSPVIAEIEFGHE